MCSGGSRGGACPSLPLPPLFWVKKEEMTEGEKASRAKKSRPPPPSPLAQGLDPPLMCAITEWDLGKLRTLLILSSFQMMKQIN